MGGSVRAKPSKASVTAMVKLGTTMAVRRMYIPSEFTESPYIVRPASESPKVP